MKKIFAVFCSLLIAFSWIFYAPLQKAEAQNSAYAYVGVTEDVEYGLQKQINRYKRLLENEASEEKKEQIISLIQTTEKLLSASSVPCATTEKDDFHLVFTSAAASVIAYFSVRGYELAAELLTHACENTELNSIYYPVNSSIVETSSVIEKLRLDENLSGSSRFPREGSVSDMDLYYSLHQFKYSKFEGGKIIGITDRYDFIKNGGFVWPDELPIQVMYEAQEAGVVIPYYSVISVEVEPTGAELTGAYRHLEYVDGTYHIFNDICDGTCEVWNCSFNRGNSHTDVDIDGICEVCEIKIADEGKTNFDKMETYFRGVWNRFRSVKNKVERKVGEKVGEGCNGSLGFSSLGCAVLVAGALLMKKRGGK